MTKEKILFEIEFNDNHLFHYGPKIWDAETNAAIAELEATGAIKSALSDAPTFMNAMYHYTTSNRKFSERSNKDGSISWLVAQ